MQNCKLKIIILFISYLFCFNAISISIEPMLPHGKLIVAIPRINHSIYFFQDANQEWQGVDVDLARDIAKNLHVPIEFNFAASSFDDIIRLVAEHQADIALGNLSITLDRAQTVLYSSVYIKLHEAFLFNRLWLIKHWSENTDLFATLNNSTLRLGTIQGSSYYRKSQTEFPHAKLNGYADANATYQALTKNEIDAIYLDDFLCEQYILDHPEQALFYKVITLTKEPDLIAIAVAHNNIRLQHWLNNYLAIKHINYSANSLLKLKAQKFYH